jgi:hypothetical protein
VRIYAAVSGDTSVFVSTRYPNLLLSFAADRNGTFFERLPYQPPRRLGDSGAFTAWTTGKKVSLVDLIAWCHMNTEAAVAVGATFECIALDVIPGTPGTMPTKREVSRATKESLANGDAMREAGLRIMEVYHVGEPMTHLDMLIERRAPGESICVGGLVGRAASIKRAVCDQVFAHVLRRSALDSLIPVHGLGLAPRLAAGSPTWRYPWVSVDSTTWLNPSKYGELITRNGRHRKSDGRKSHASASYLGSRRILAAWIKRENEMTRLWEGRGVRYIEEAVPA